MDCFDVFEIISIICWFREEMIQTATSWKCNLSSTWFVFYSQIYLPVLYVSNHSTLKISKYNIKVNDKYPQCFRWLLEHVAADLCCDHHWLVLLRVHCWEMSWSRGSVRAPEVTGVSINTSCTGLENFLWWLCSLFQLEKKTPCSVGFVTRQQPRGLLGNLSISIKLWGQNKLLGSFSFLLRFVEGFFRLLLVWLNLKERWEMGRENKVVIALIPPTWLTFSYLYRFLSFLENSRMVWSMRVHYC